MNPAVEDFLNKFSQDTEDLIRNVAAFTQLAHIRNHSYKQTTHPCHQRFPERPESMPSPSTTSRPPPKKKIDSAPHGTQTCTCLFKQIKSTNTEKERKSKVKNDDYQSNRRSTSQEPRGSCVPKRPSSIQAQKRCFAEVLSEKPPSNKKRLCCHADESCDDNSSTKSHKSDKCVCRANHGVPVDTKDTQLEIEEFSEKFSEAQRSLQILRNRIADLNYYVNEGESKMRMKQKTSTLCPPCPPSPAAGYGVPELPQNALPEFPPLKIKKLIPRNKFLEQGGVENNFSFGHMPAMPPHAVPVLPGTFVSYDRNSSCTPRSGSSRRSNQRVSFGSCSQNK